MRCARGLFRMDSGRFPYGLLARTRHPFARGFGRVGLAGPPSPAKGGGMLPAGGAGRLNIHGVVHALDTLFFVEQIGNYLSETETSVQRARSKFSELKKSTVDQNLGDRPASGVLGDCHFFQI